MICAYVAMVMLAFGMVCRSGCRILLRRGCTTKKSPQPRLIFFFFFLFRILLILESHRSPQGGHGAHPPHPSPRSTLGFGTDIKRGIVQLRMHTLAKESNILKG